jgi:hypothetical protein
LSGTTHVCCLSSNIVVVVSGVVVVVVGLFSVAETTNFEIKCVTFARFRPS